MQDRKDVAAALGVSEKLLCYVLYGARLRRRYQQFDIPKRSGGIRIISAPPRGLLNIQRRAYQVLLQYYRPKFCVHGFVPNRGIVTNARPHARKRLLVNFDLEDFFPSIYFGRVRGLFTSRPFGFGAGAATVLAQLSCRDDGILPQGGALSPLISNLVCRGLDNDLIELAKQHMLYYSRYADDISFSTSRPSFPSELVQLNSNPPVPGDRFEEIVNGHSFTINSAKIKFRSRDRRQEVTGLTVNQFPNLPRKFIRDLSGAIFAWERHGYAAAQEMYESKFKTSGGTHLRNVIRGRIAYLKMVRSEHDFIYRRLARQFNRLESQPITIVPITHAQPSAMHNLPCAWNKWVDKYLNEVFLLTCVDENFDPARGTAFHIGGGLLATARHCVYDRHDSVRPDLQLHIGGDAKEVTAVNPQAQINQTIDVAALQLTELANQRGIPTQLRLPQIGEEVAAIGFPTLSGRNLTVVVHVGTVEALPTNHRQDERYIQVSFQSGGGLSGGCLIDKSGQVIGIMIENIFLAAATQMDDANIAEPIWPIPPRPYGQAIPIEYFDAFIHGEALTATTQVSAAEGEVSDGTATDPL